MPDDAEAPKPNGRSKPELLTDQEAADRMGWSRVKVQRLRLAGKLPYYPGRPALIDAADLADVEPAEVRRREQLKLERERENAERAAREAEQAPIRRATISWLRHQMRENRKLEKRRTELRAAVEAAARTDEK